MKKTITTLMAFSLAGNVFPVINVLAIFGLFPLYFLNKDARQLEEMRYGPRTAQKVLLAAFAYWLLSYTLTGASFGNFLSFDFLRFDGALFIAYLPLLLFTDVCLDPKFIRRTLTLILTALAFVALLGLAEFVDSTIIPLGLSALPEPLQLLENASLSSDIFHGFFRAHNAAGATYAMASLISFSLLTGTEKPTLFSWATFCLALNFIGLALTQSRTAYLAFLAALLLIFFRKWEMLKKSIKYGALILVPLLYFLLVQPTVSKRTEDVSNLEDPNIVMRFLYYQRAVDDFVQSPIIGIGFARYNDDLKIFSGVPHLVYVATGGVSQNDDLHAHNSYLHFLAEGGVVGLVLMLSVWIATFRWLAKTKEIFNEGSLGYCLAQAIQACIVCEFFMSMTEHMMGTATSSLTIFTLVGLLLNLVGWKYRVAALAIPEPAVIGGLQSWPAR